LKSVRSYPVNFVCYSLTINSLSKNTYQIAIQVFAFLMKVGALFSHKIKLGVVGRKGLLRRLENDFSAHTNGRPVAWFHAASLGEFEQGRPVMEAFRDRYPDYFILLTFFSPSGYEIRKNYSGADYVCYLPIDTLSNARRFIRAVNPRIVFFIKYEFWFNYVNELLARGSGLLAFSSIFRTEQVFFQSYGAFFRRILSMFDHIFVQNKASVELLWQVNITNCSVAGDTRFDRVRTIAANARELPEIEAFSSGKPCIVAGSVWEADMQVLIPSLNRVTGSVKAIIAPHEIKKDQIEGWRKSLKGSTVLYSELTQKTGISSYDYLIVDNIGMLSSLYKYGNMAYIGGAFGAGLHNILEAATFGLPLMFGNKSFQRFQEATDLVEYGGAFPIGNAMQAGELIDRWTWDPVACQEIGEINENYVLSGIGATGRIMEKVEEILGQ
jgi:3-deoxy-D-manno-octulosonic-acid transferase